MRQPRDNTRACHHCAGKGYTEIRDCSGEIQRTETCSFCEGSGYLVIETEVEAIKK